MVALTGFSYEEMCGRFAGTKKSGRNNKVAVRRGSTILKSKFAYVSSNLWSVEIKLGGISGVIGVDSCCRY